MSEVLVHFKPNEIEVTAEVLGYGARFQVFRGIYRGPGVGALEPGQDVAVKVVSVPDGVELYAQEQALASEWGFLNLMSSHTGIVATYGLVRLADTNPGLNGRYALVLERLMGATLDANIKVCQEKRKFQGARDWDDATREIIMRVGDAVSHMHSHGVMHNDLKPDNVMVMFSPEEGELDVVLLDLEMAGSGEGGRIEYSAPERLEHGVATVRTDIYSLGVLLYQTLTGALPYPETDSPVEALSQRSTAVDEMPPGSKEYKAWQLIPEVVQPPLKRALSFDPKDRPRSVSEFLGQLQVAVAKNPARWPYLVASFGVVLAVAFFIQPRGALSNQILDRPAFAECVQEFKVEAELLCRSQHRRGSSEALRCAAVLSEGLEAAPELCPTKFEKLANRLHCRNGARR